MSSFMPRLVLSFSGVRGVAPVPCVPMRIVALDASLRDFWRRPTADTLAVRAAGPIRCLPRMALCAQLMARVYRDGLVGQRSKLVQIAFKMTRSARHHVIVRVL